MTQNEAIYCLKTGSDLHSEICEECPLFEATRCTQSCYEDTVEIAIKALDKQVPKTPKEYEDKYYGCPICGNVLLHKWKKYPNELMSKECGLPYCLSCGQRIDWEEE